MSQIEERKKKWQIIYSPLAFTVLLVTLVLMARAAWSVYNHQITSARDKERVQAELADSNQRLLSLKKQLAVLETSKGVDEEIRSKFNVAKPGEGVAVIISGVVPPTTTTIVVPEKTWWQKFIGIFGF